MVALSSDVCVRMSSGLVGIRSGRFLKGDVRNNRITKLKSTLSRSSNDHHHISALLQSIKCDTINSYACVAKPTVSMKIIKLCFSGGGCCVVLPHQSINLINSIFCNSQFVVFIYFPHNDLFFFCLARTIWLADT